MTFEQQYTESDFLKVIPYSNPISIAAIISEIGCAKNTAKRYLAELEREHKITRANIQGSIHFGYVRIPSQEITLEGVVGPDGIIKIDDKFKGSKYKLILYKDEDVNL
ncbi:hypothetical protein FXW07_07200 [Methanosarcina sp. DH1]|uniref:hypothetical protein n=1 Tax=Methanosarcina sp. DH1 TaxID=2605695 RepID=UPI001E5D171B|nr:hypothetical protein [Methanosarcina sp. DH1]MCC4766406.1 hypothetical protein [Methanosarcina sp. DH1]